MSLKADCKEKVEPEYLEGEPGPFKEEPIFLEEPLSVKEEPLFLEEPLKEEPLLKEEPILDVSAWADLYTDHVIKSDLVVGPIILQPQDAAFAIPVLEKSCEQLAPTKATCKPLAQAHRCYICQRTFFDDSLLINHVCIPQDVLDARTIPHIVSEQSCKTDQDNNCRQKPNFIRNYSAGEPIYCDICQKQFKYKSSLKLHRLTHFEEFLCKICNVKFKYENDIDAHHKYHVGFDSNDNNVKDTHRKREKGRRRDIKKELKYCEICKKYSSSKKHFIKHKQRHTGEIFPCHICKSMFMTEQLLLFHKQLHIGEETFICDICQKVFMRKYKLVRHIKYHLRPKSTIKRFSCDICEKKFLNSSSLNNHKTVHAPEKEYSCGICEKRFGLKRVLLKHVQYVHEGKKPFKCETCQKAFPYGQNLRMHELIHGEKKLICKICGKQFHRQSSLIRHNMAIHTVRDPFICDVCKRHFNRKTGLISHIKIKHTESHSNKPLFFLYKRHKVF